MLGLPVTASLQSPLAPFKKLLVRYRNALLLLLILAVFIAFNKLAFRSYFSDDDFANLPLALFSQWWGLLKQLFTLELLPNFRPFGVLFYKIAGQAAGLHFEPYVAVLQAFHLVTSLLLWIFLRRLGLRPLPAALGCAFFTLHMSTLPAYWKPMYVFDVLCGFWLMLALLLYQRDWFFPSLFCAWLAFKSKEMELMLPLVLLLYAWLFDRDRNSGRLRWRPLIPFFLMSLSFGLQSLFHPDPESPYALHVTPASVWSGVAYYGSRLLYAPFAGLIVSIGLLFLRVRLITFGVLGFWLLMFPMFGFPLRQAGAYLYVPLLLFSVAIAGVAQWRPWWALLFLAIWIPASYDQLRAERRPLLAYRYEHLPYIDQIRASLAAHPAPNAVVFEGTPVDFNVWGQKGLFPYILPRYDLPVYSASEREALDTLRRPGTLLFTWDYVHRRLHTSSFPGEGREISFVDFEKDNPLWQLKTGWKSLQGYCRWIAPRAVLTLRQPAGDGEFSMRVNLGPGQAESIHQVLRVSSAGRSLGEHRFVKSGFQTLRWPVSFPTEAVADFEIALDPAFLPSEGSEPLGVMVCSCGFLPRGPSDAGAPR